jgi:hypothetical protein
MLMSLCLVRDATTKALRRLEAKARKAKKLAHKEAREQQRREDSMGMCEFYYSFEYLILI